MVPARELTSLHHERKLDLQKLQQVGNQQYIHAAKSPRIA